LIIVIVIDIISVLIKPSSIALDPIVGIEQLSKQHLRHTRHLLDLFSCDVELTPVRDIRCTGQPDPSPSLAVPKIVPRTQRVQIRARRRIPARGILRTSSAHHGSSSNPHFIGYSTDPGQHWSIL
jgi:hypothetical protein